MIKLFRSFEDIFVRMKTCYTAAYRKFHCRSCSHAYYRFYVFFFGNDYPAGNSVRMRKVNRHKIVLVYICHFFLSKKTYSPDFRIFVCLYPDRITEFFLISYKRRHDVFRGRVNVFDTRGSFQNTVYRIYEESSDYKFVSQITEYRCYKKCGNENQSRDFPCHRRDNVVDRRNNIPDYKYGQSDGPNNQKSLKEIFQENIGQIFKCKFFQWYFYPCMVSLFP